MRDSLDFNANLTGEALDLSHKYQSVLDRLPRTFLVSQMIELQKWPTLFEPEKAYFRELLRQLQDFSASQFGEIFGGLVSFENSTGCQRVAADNPEEFQKRVLERIQRQGQYSRWRSEVEKIFEKLQPLVEHRLYSAHRERRLVVILYGEGMAIERDRLWSRFGKMGVRVPLDLDGATASGAFLGALFTGRREPTRHTPAPTLFHLRRELQNASPLDSWVIEAGDALHALCEKQNDRGEACATGMSYDRLRAYRERLTESIYAKVLSGVRSPLELADYLKTLQVEPREGVTLFFNDNVLSFVRDIFLAGAGTLIINNTFVEWGAVQALKRAQPTLLVARFGVRDKMKPFSSLLLFSRPRPTDQIPILQDPLASFVDAELLAYYIWLKAEQGPPYRANTLYLLLAEGVDEMLAVMPDPGNKPATPLPTASLPDVAATMAHWLEINLPESPGRVIGALVS